MQDWLFSHDAEFWAGMFALGVYHGARMSEVIRSGILSIPRTQFEAAQAMGLTTWQAYRLVILPIAVRLIVPPATSESLNLLKNSSVALTISVPELTFQTRQIETYTAKAIEALTAGTLIYLAMCLSIAWIMARVERRFAIPGDDRPGGRRLMDLGGHRPQLEVPDPPGLAGDRQLRRRHLAAGHPRHRARLPAGHRHRAGPAGPRRRGCGARPPPTWSSSAVCHWSW